MTRCSQRNKRCRRLCQSLHAIKRSVLQIAKNVYTDNHSGISARQHDSKVSMTDLVSAEDDVSLRVSTGLAAAIDEGRRMTIICLCMPLDTTVSEWQKGVRNDHNLSPHVIGLVAFG